MDSVVARLGEPFVEIDAATRLTFRFTGWRDNCSAERAGPREFNGQRLSGSGANHKPRFALRRSQASGDADLGGPALEPDALIATCRRSRGNEQECGGQKHRGQPGVALHRLCYLSPARTCSCSSDPLNRFRSTFPEIPLSWPCSENCQIV